MAVAPLLRLRIVDPAETFQLRFATRAAAALGKPSGVSVAASGDGLVLGAATEQDLAAAWAILHAAFPSATAQPIEVVLSTDPEEAEPWVRIRVRTPEDHLGDVVADLHKRRGWLELMEDVEGLKLVVASAPIAELIGYAAALSTLANGRASFEYSFLEYRTRNRPPNEPVRA